MIVNARVFKWDICRGETINTISILLGYAEGVGREPEYVQLEIKDREIMQFMDIAAVNRWSKMGGRNVRVQIDSTDSIIQPSVRIGHIMKDMWLDILQNEHS